MKAHAKYLHITDKKMNVVAGIVRQKSVDSAIARLKFLPKKAALPLRKVIESAVANAVNNYKQKRDELIIREIIVNEGPELKRFQPVSRGRAHPIRKGTCHVTVTLQTKTLSVKP